MKFAVYAFVLLGANLALAQFSTPPQGEYARATGGWGILRAQADSKFEIETIGGNAHTCGLSGTISKGKATFEDSSCEVTFKYRDHEVEVATNDSDDCRAFCGMRAGFEGFYSKLSPLCTTSAIENSKGAFKKYYLAKNYAAALKVITPVATQCERFLYWIDSAWVLNDLALTQFKLGNKAACIKTLQPLAKDAAMSDEQIKEKYPPTDADNYLGVMHATRTNLKLCAKR